MNIDDKERPYPDDNAIIKKVMKDKTKNALLIWS